jgi:hypothetical protein
VPVHLTPVEVWWLIERVGAGVALETVRDADVRARVYHALAVALDEADLPAAPALRPEGTE